MKAKFFFVQSYPCVYFVQNIYPNTIDFRKSGKTQYAIHFMKLILYFRFICMFLCQQKLLFSQELAIKQFAIRTHSIY